MNKIIFQSKVQWMDKNGKNIEIVVSASSAQDLLKKLESAISEKSKWSLMKLFPHREY